MNTCAQGRWRHIGASVTGTSHIERGTPCQDSSVITRLDAGEGEVLILAASDGAGSAALSDVGSETACKAVLELAASWFEHGGSTSQLSQEILGAWVDGARRAVVEAAAARGVTVREMACTLLFSVAGAHAAAFVQIGDGAIVVDKSERLEVAFWPQHGEYINTTRFLTDRDALPHVQYRIVHRGINEIAILTDGVEALALHYASRSVYEPFFRPIFDQLSGEGEDESASLQDELVAFLGHERVNERTHDDKTLLVATRRAMGTNASASVVSAPVERDEPTEQGDVEALVSDSPHLGTSGNPMERSDLEPGSRGRRMLIAALLLLFLLRKRSSG